ncbi:MAG: response regulator, partial [Gammaproteobacteria bacterium]|nr:response regulator [Gammaproteobacteria bacterium]
MTNDHEEAMKNKKSGFNWKIIIALSVINLCVIGAVLFIAYQLHDVQTRAVGFSAEVREYVKLSGPVMRLERSISFVEKQIIAISVVIVLLSLLTVMILYRLLRRSQQAADAILDAKETAEAARNEALYVIDDIVLVSQGLAQGNLTVMPKTEYRGDFLRIKEALESTSAGLYRVIEDIVRVAQGLANGDLTVTPRAEYKGDFTHIKDALGATSAGLGQVIGDIVRVSQGIAEGDQGIMPAAEYKGNFIQIKDALVASSTGLRLLIDDIVQVSQGVADGNLNIAPEAEYKGDFVRIRNALEAAGVKLAETTSNAAMEDWSKTGQTQLNEKMSGEQDVATLAKNVITFLCARLDAKVGSFYLAKQTGGQDVCLRMMASYAYTRRKNLANEFELGEGLVGQAALERKSIVISEAPDDYVHVQSGLGNSLPRNILVVPFLYENTLKGVIELGFLRELTEIQLEFLNQTMQGIGITVNAAESRTRMQELLEQSQAQSEELRSQQEKMQQTNEELQKQSEEMQIQQEKLCKNNKKLQTQSEEMQNQQEELRQTNEELESRTQELEKERAGIRAQNRELEKKRQAIQIKAEELELASKYKSEFLANMSHELRTPLNSLLILAQLLADNKENNLTGQQMECARTMHSAGTDLLALINEILDLSKVEAGKIIVNSAEIPIAELTGSLMHKFRPVAEEKSLAFTINAAENLPQTLHTDGQRLKQVINNLLSNAFKFTEKGGITLAIERPAANEDLSRSGLDPAKSIAVSVIDSGIGIPADKQKVIFEAFQQADGATSRRYGGTGLGLSISRQLVQLMGGEIKLHSEKGKGSRFTAYLPERLKPQTDGGIRSSAGGLWAAAAERRESAAGRAPEPAAPAEAMPAVEDDRTNLKPGDKSILIIEDDRNFLTVLAGLAREKEFKCLFAEDGRNGLLLAQEYFPSAVILDIGLPQVDGWMVMERLKNNPHTRHIPVHFVSGSDHHLEAGKMGAIGYSLKPASMAELGESFKNIERFIDKRIKNLLVITDDEQHRQAILKTVENEQIAITLAGDSKEAWQQLNAREYECIILDINLERNAGIEFLKRLQTEDTLSRIPVVVYAERNLTQQEEAALQHCASRITVKAVRSPERLLDEASLFLHEVEAKLPKEQRQMLHIAHDKEAILA